MRHAFSLVELSIVLVILGLLTGGILAGQSLIRASELRAVSTEAARYITAVHAFRDKYFALPGDFATATSIWGKNSTDCNGHTGTAATPGTCNGDGDNTMEFGATSATGEMFQFWKQLALAGLIEGTYNGLAGAAGGQNTVHGTNTPNSKLKNAGWATYTLDMTGANHGAFTNFNYRNEIHIGADGDGSSGYGPVLKPEEAWNVDTKIDDGQPQRGKVMAIFWDTCTDAANAAALNGAYALTLASTECSLSFVGAY